MIKNLIKKRTISKIECEAEKIAFIKTNITNILKPPTFKDELSEIDLQNRVNKLKLFYNCLMTVKKFSVSFQLDNKPYIFNKKGKNLLIKKGDVL